MSRLRNCIKPISTSYWPKQKRRSVADNPRHIATANTERNTEQRLIAEKMIVTVSGYFMRLRPDQIDDGINWALRIVGQFMKADISRVFMVSTDGKRLTNTHEWCAPNITTQKSMLMESTTWRDTWYQEKLRSREYIYLRSLEHLPKEVEAFKRDLEVRGVKTLLTVPIFLGENLIGTLGIDTLTVRMEWSEEALATVKVVAELIGLAIERKQADEAIRHRVDFERLVAEISAKFVVVEPDDLDEALNYALQAIGEFSNVDASRLFLRRGDPPVWSNTHEWCAPGITSQRGRLTDVANWHLAQWWTNEMAAQKMVYIADVETANQETNGLFDEFIQRGVKSALSLPLLRGDEYIGELGLDAMRIQKDWSEENIRLLGVITQILIAALDRRDAADALKRERRLLETRVQERTHELQQLLDVSQVIGSTLDLESLLRVVLQQLRGVLPYGSASIFRRQDQWTMNLLAHVGTSGANLPRTWIYRSHSQVYERDLLEQRLPIIIADTSHNSQHAISRREMIAANIEASNLVQTTSLIEVPLLVHDKVIGSLLLESHEHDRYTEQHAKLVMAFANQAAIAIENAQLHKQGVQAAALAERTRLARELHDSVSQALFGIVLGTRTVLQLDTHRQADQLKDAMAYVLSLSEAALAEIRSLIFELRPESLQKEGLIAAYQKQTASLCARHKIEVVTDLGHDEPPLPLEAKEALYRIALEAIQNTIRHAKATRVYLQLKVSNQAVSLEVKDNGVGFDTQQNLGGHYGLHTMRERAVQYGGQFEVVSAPGHGTAVRVQIMLPEAMSAISASTRLRISETLTI